jgi:phosphohistidine phosphatase
MAFSLFLLRHAETEAQLPGQSDFDRALLSHGYDQITHLKQRLIKKRVHADAVISSTAKRARTTVLLVADAFGIEPEHIHYDQLIYTSDTDDLVDLLRDADDRWRCLVIVGHNPTLSELTSYLINDPTIGLKTADMAYIELDIVTWSSVQKGTGKLKEIISGTPAY